MADAWLKGSWNVLGGVMFDVFDPATHIVVPPNADYLWRCGGDWGTAAPATCILLGQLRDNAGTIRAGSIIAFDETDTAEPSDLSLGIGTPPQAFAEMIRESCGSYGIRYPHVVMDDARGLQSETVIQLLRENGISAGQWNLIRQLLSNAVTGDGGLEQGPGCKSVSSVSHVACGPA